MHRVGMDTNDVNLKQKSNFNDLNCSFMLTSGQLNTVEVIPPQFFPDNLNTRCTFSIVITVAVLIMWAACVWAITDIICINAVISPVQNSKRRWLNVSIHKLDSLNSLMRNHHVLIQIIRVQIITLLTMPRTLEPFSIIDIILKCHVFSYKVVFGRHQNHFLLTDIFPITCSALCSLPSSFILHPVSNGGTKRYWQRAIKV